MSRLLAFRPILLLLLAAVLASCAAPGLVSKGPASCSAESLLAFSERFGSLPQREAEAALADARAAFQRTGADCDRLRLALILGHPEGKASRDEPQALKLLNGYLASGAGKQPGLVALSRYAADALACRNELDARWRVATRKAGEERTRADALQRKIDELKQIEQLLEQRQRN